MVTRVDILLCGSSSCAFPIVGLHIDPVQFYTVPDQAFEKTRWANFP